MLATIVVASFQRQISALLPISLSCPLPKCRHCVFCFKIAQMHHLSTVFGYEKPFEHNSIELFSGFFCRLAVGLFIDFRSHSKTVGKFFVKIGSALNPYFSYDFLNRQICLGKQGSCPFNSIIFDVFTR